MRKKHVLSVVGARPNFMKMAPLLRELSKEEIFHSSLVHTGQHYDEVMSKVFFRDLNMQAPDFNLNVGSGSHAVQTAEIMKSFERVCDQAKPDLVIVAGDVNSTLACSLTAVKLQIPVAHLEAGLRSFDRTMPEEINRIVTDSISDVLFTTEESGNVNLRREGIAEEKIHFVGNTMIDSLVSCAGLLHHTRLGGALGALDGAAYFLATVHRPSNVDDPGPLSQVLDILESASQFAPVLFVTHPRTRSRLEEIGRDSELSEIDDELREIRQGSVYFLPPLPYVEFFKLMSKCTAVLTDSGGIQEETTFLRIPCLTMRDNTERPSTVDLGTNQLVGLDEPAVRSCLKTIISGEWKVSSVPPFWDGRAAERVVEVLKKILGRN